MTDSRQNTREYAQNRANETGRKYLVTNMGHVLLHDARNATLAKNELGGIADIYYPKKSSKNRESNPSRRSVHTAKFDRCVEDVKARGGAYDPYAVCTASLGEAGSIRKGHRQRNPGRKARINYKGFVIVYAPMTNRWHVYRDGLLVSEERSEDEALDYVRGNARKSNPLRRSKR